jgi:probable phosphoglycerate mutase
VFFCHFGITCVMIAHLLGVSPIITLQGMSAEPTAIATLCTDDRFGREVNFRLHGFGDINHLPEQGIGRVNYQ